MVRSRRQFIDEQGFSGAASPSLYNALMFQPRAVGAWLAAGVIVQSAWWFAALAAILWWSALVPAHNPFDALYNTAIARRVGVTRLASGTAPRRFSAALAGTMALAIAAALGLEAAVTARVLEAVFVVAVAAVLAARFCAGAWLYRAVTRPSTASRDKRDGAGAPA